MHPDSSILLHIANMKREEQIRSSTLRAYLVSTSTSRTPYNRARLSAADALTRLAAYIKPEHQETWIADTRSAS